ncbi:MAG: formylglycine-generating enzyme family protein [Symploca sp. SIO3C6]|nr:formylglycine-generating enzyme family protein [Symploca sp. SIO3C6]
MWVVSKNEQPTLNNFEFSVVSTNAQGREVSRRRQQAQQQLTENLGYGVQLEMVAIDDGIFMMGSPDSEAGRSDYEVPQHLVKVAPFFMGKYPVTQEQWLIVAGFPQVNRSLNPNPSRFKGSNLPVECISWYDAQEFCNRLSQQTGREYRLPTEAQWEYACRAGTTSLYHFGEAISPELANYSKNRNRTTPVGSFQVANNFGLYDMHGNVWEWCADHWHENYEGAPSDGQAWLGSDNDNRRIIRGGSWNNRPSFCRCASRNDFYRDLDDYVIGLRVVCVVPRTL